MIATQPCQSLFALFQNIVVTSIYVLDIILLLDDEKSRVGVLIGVLSEMS
jgi:hypothetical protein